MTSWLVMSEMVGGWSSLQVACSVCFGAADEPAADGAVDAAIVLGVWAYAVLASGVVAAWWMQRRASARRAAAWPDASTAWPTADEAR